MEQDQQSGLTAQKLGQSVMQFNKAFMHSNRAELSHTLTGCKPSEIHVLFIIIKRGQTEGRGLKVSEISKRLHVTSPTVTQLLKGLEANGLVERYTDPADRRVVGIVLTEKGQKIAERAEEIFALSFQGLTKYLGEEQSNQLAELLIKAFNYFDDNRTKMPQWQWNGDEEI